ncbi:lytic transglycosylase domain-containing protein [Rhizobium beringeri]
MRRLFSSSSQKRRRARVLTSGWHLQSPIRSGFGAHVNSPAGARGPMQLIPATAVRYKVADICDAAQNIRGGVSYLKDLTAMFGGNIHAGGCSIQCGRGVVSLQRMACLTLPRPFPTLPWSPTPISALTMC